MKDFFSIRISVVIAVVVVGAVVATISMQSDPVSLREQAQMAIREGRLAEGQKLWEEYLDTHRDDHASRLDLAKFLLASDVDAAASHLQVIPESSGDYAEALKLLAYIGITHGPGDTAEDALNRLLEIDPEDSAALLALSELYFHEARFKDALPLIHRTLNVQGERAETHILLADTLSSLGRHAEMVQPLRKAIELDPENLAAHSNLAFACIHAGDPEAARTEALWCLERKSEWPEVRRLLATSLRDLGMHEESLREIRIVLSSSPRDLDARILEAEILMFQRRPDLVYDSLLPLLADHGDDRTLISHLARAAAMSGRTEESMDLQRKLQSLIPDRDSSQNY